MKRKNLILSTLCLLLGLFVNAQSQPTDSVVHPVGHRHSKPAIHHLIEPPDSAAQDQQDTTPIRRWLVSFNPLGLLEVPGAFGLGIGYRISQKFELWSETSVLLNTSLYDFYSYAKGYRQVIQLKWFAFKDPTQFLALEMRYKYFHTNGTDTFQLASTNAGPYSIFQYRSTHFVSGIAAQYGARYAFDPKGRWVLEGVIGAGLKRKETDYQGVPAGYVRKDNTEDIVIRDVLQDKANLFTLYFPGSVRFIYTLGKIIKE